jgi:hypothetical protein
MKKIATDTFQFKVALVNGVKSIALNSRSYYQHFLNTKTKVGDIGSLTLKLKKPTRSENQLNYYAVIVGLIADYTGDTWDELHSALMILKWGTKKVLGVQVRKSISNRARIPKDEMSEQIEFALKKAKELEIKVPTKQELGYIDN